MEKAINYVGKSYASIKNAEKDLYNIKLGFSHPIIYEDAHGKQPYFEMLYKERDAIARMRGVLSGDQSFYTISKDARDFIENEAAIKVERMIMEDANKRLAALGGKPLNLKEMTLTGDANGKNLGANTPGLKEMVADAAEPVEMQAIEASNRIKRHIKQIGRAHV